jgi:hypothetical protein
LWLCVGCLWVGLWLCGGCVCGVVGVCGCVCVVCVFHLLYHCTIDCCSSHQQPLFVADAFL